MSESNFSKYSRGLLIFLGGLLIIFLVGSFIFSDDVRPNQNFYDEVVEFAGYKPCCDSIWLEMCMDYQSKHNESFDCFQKG